MFYNFHNLKENYKCSLRILKLYPVDGDSICYLLHMIKLELQDNAAFLIFYKNVKSKDIIYIVMSKKTKVTRLKIVCRHYFHYLHDACFLSLHLQHVPVCLWYEVL